MKKASGVRFTIALGFMTLSSICLLAAASFQTGELVHGYLIWNIVLAWVPFGLAVWLVRALRRRLWSDWVPLILTTVWVAFLPNSFYIVSDLIHLAEADSSTLVLSAVTFASFVCTGICLGISSLYIVHLELLRRMSPRTAATLIGLLLLLSSGAIYIGRDLRWNSWDVLLNPFGLLFDTSDRLLHPAQYGAALAVIIPFFVLLGSIYAVTWQATRFVADDHRLTK